MTGERSSRGNKRQKALAKQERQELKRQRRRTTTWQERAARRQAEPEHLQVDQPPAD